MQFTISSDKAKLNIEAIHDYLCHKSYWAKGRSIERVKKSIENSLCFGMYDEQGNMLGFGRVVTDYVVFAYLMDFLIFEQHQGKGLGTQLAKHIIEHPDLQVRLWFLGTHTAQNFYKKLGFQQLDNPDRYMFKRDENYT